MHHYITYLWAGDFSLSVNTRVFHVPFIKIATSYNVGCSENKCIIVFSVQKMKLSCLIRDSLFTLHWLEGETHSEHTVMCCWDQRFIKWNLEAPGGPSEGPGKSSPSEIILNVFFCSIHICSVNHTSCGGYFLRKDYGGMMVPLSPYLYIIHQNTVKSLPT